MIDAIKKLCLKIAVDQNLVGAESLELYSEFISNEINSEKQFNDILEFNGHNEFSGADIKEYVEAASLLIGSIGTFLSLRKSSRRKNEKLTFLLLKNSWKNRLLAEGLDNEKVEEIVSSFTNDLKLILLEDEQ